MRKQNVTEIAQLLSAMKDAANKIEEAERNSDGEMLMSAKREILAFQKKINELI